MHVSALRGSAGELLDGSFELTRRYFLTIVRAAFPALLLTALVEIVLTALGVPSSSSMIGMFVVFIPWSLAEGLAIAGCWHLLQGESGTFLDSWRLVSQRAATVCGTYTIKWILIVPGLFLLIVPGLHLIVLFFALPTVCIVENVSFWTAFKRSRVLSRGSFKRIAATLGLVEVIGMALATLVPILVPGGTWESPSTWDRLSAWAVGIVFLPLRAAVMTLLYLDLRVSKEGYDLSVDFSDLSRAG